LSIADTAASGDCVLGGKQKSSISVTVEKLDYERTRAHSRSQQIISSKILQLFRIKSTIAECRNQISR
jgi:hypothetical protein